MRLENDISRPCPHNTQTDTFCVFLFHSLTSFSIQHQNVMIEQCAPGFFSFFYYCRNFPANRARVNWSKILEGIRINRNEIYPFRFESDVIFQLENMV